MYVFKMPLKPVITLSRVVLLIITCVMEQPQTTWGHGRLIEPPSRASAWRYGFKTPPNYNDHELYCGGYSRQYNRNGGKCGICGDPWDVPLPRPHEIGGTYGQGLIVRTYSPSSVIIIRVELTANHFGFFVFKLCENFRNTTQECLDKIILKLASSYANRFNGRLVQDDLSLRGVRFYPKDGNRVYEMRYKLPNVSCMHCVLQWTYTAGNNWGTCENGTESVGCGPQETFRACADISIQKGHISNEIPTTSEENAIGDGDETQTETPTINHQQFKYDGFKTLIVVGISLFIVLLLISILYMYYYELGRRIKRCLHSDKLKETQSPIRIPPPPKGIAPVPPPRGRRNSVNSQIQGQPYNTSSINMNESLA